MFVTSKSVGEVVRQRLDSLSPAERRLARVLLASYPIAGLESGARFAERARVSPPTVTRFITKLGFRGYPEFQENLRHEVQARLSSPLARYRDEPKRESPVDDALAVWTSNLKSTVELLSARDMKEAVELLADVRRRVMVPGGRVSATLARYLAGQLHLLRPGIGLVDAERSAPAQQLIDMRRTDLLVASITGGINRTPSTALASPRPEAATWSCSRINGCRRRLRSRVRCWSRVSRRSGRSTHWSGRSPSWRPSSPRCWASSARAPRRGCR